MIQRRMVIMAVLVVFAMPVGVYADMMPMSPSNVASCPSVHPCNRTNSEPVNQHDDAWQIVSDLGFLSVASLAGGPIHTEPTDPTQLSVQVLTTDRNSLDLCRF